MAANLKKAFVVDVEATCWRTPVEQGEKQNEIIEIGFVTLDLRTGQVLTKDSYPVRPIMSEVSEFCTELTGWTQPDVAGAPLLREVLDTIAEQHRVSSVHTWWSYGLYDRFALVKKAEQLYGIDPRMNPFGVMHQHFNIKTLLSMKYGWGKEVGMAQALAKRNIALTGRHHNGSDDAENIAKLVWDFLRAR